MRTRLALFLVVAMLGLAGLSLVWTPHAVDGTSIMSRLQGPGADYWLGTDHNGRDLLSMSMIGLRTSLLVSALAITLGLVLGVPLGLVAASYQGSWLDELIMRGNDIVFAFPAVLTALMISAVFGPAAINALLAIAIFTVPVFSRVVRGAALSLWSRDFTRYAQSLGQESWRISLRHILPNVMTVLIVQASVQLSLAIVAEAALSFIGVGVQPPIPSLGRMLADARTFASYSPWVVIIPGGFLVALVLAFGQLGEALGRNQQLERRG